MVTGQMTWLPLVPLPVRQLLVGVLGVLHEGHPELPLVGLAGGAAGVLPDLLKNGEEDGGENRDDRNDNEQLDQGKTKREADGALVRETGRALFHGAFP